MVIFMVDPGTVSGDLNKYMNSMDNCKAKFEGLDSDWKGPSREKLKASVDAFISEAKVVNKQMINLSSACSSYKNYDELHKICLQLEKSIEDEKNKFDDDGNYCGNQSLINRWEQELKQHIETMNRLNSNARNFISAVSEVVKEVDIGNTEFVSKANVV